MCCFTPTETVGLSATEAQDDHLDFHTAPEPCYRPKSTVNMVLNVHRNHQAY